VLAHHNIQTKTYALQRAYHVTLITPLQHCCNYVLTSLRFGVTTRRWRNQSAIPWQGSCPRKLVCSIPPHPTRQTTCWL